MPTSTRWRGTGIEREARENSPARPSDRTVERITPDPYDPTSSVSSSYAAGRSIGGDALQGLGLSNSGLPDRLRPSLQPNHLYIDRNGGAHVGAKVVKNSRSHEPLASMSLHNLQPHNSRYRNENRNTRGRGHTRSGSTIDDLATAAIVTSPDFANGGSHLYNFSGSPTNHSNTRPSTSYQERHGYGVQTEGPPAKRIKSEKLPALEWSPRGDYSPTNNEEPRHEDAFLLLGLRNEVNFKIKTSPSAPTPLLFDRSPAIFAPQPARRMSGHDASHNMTPQEKTLYPNDITMHDAPSTNTSIVGLNGVESQSSPGRGLEGSPHRQLASQGQKEVRLRDKTETDQQVHTNPSLLSVQSSEIAQGETREDDKLAEQTETNRPQSRRPRRVKPEIQAEVCAECKHLQRDLDDETAPMLWISCNACTRWFHSACVGLKSKFEARSVDKFVCKDCEPKHGKTTFVRKSSRARTAIDYAGLNQGVIKSSADTSMHHYIQPIKEGKITFLPDDFARIRPELLTAEFMESFEGMKRPFVVPACWNPRFGAPKPDELSSQSEIGMECIRYDSSGNDLDIESEPTDNTVDEEVIDCDQDLLDMVMPRDLTVRKVADLYGPEDPVPVIDVKSQETKGIFTLRQWADYYELPGDKPIRNVISLEVSESRLGRLIRRPKVVRQLDLEDCVWDAENRTTSKKRPVQFYCLMSVADSYTDFHIDFGGSSVYYHILKGTKTFFFIPPEDKYLKKYEDWCNSDTQNTTFLGDICGHNCTRVDLHEGDTAFIPAGWIHAVWTPEDSLVIGGNFLTRLDYEVQLKVVNVEKATKVSPKFRYPFFQMVMWYALIRYLEDDPIPEDLLREFQEDPDFVYLRINPTWHELGDLANDSEPGSQDYNARHYSRSEISGLVALRDYLYRTARICADLPVPDINKKGIDAVKASVPKGHGDPLVLIKSFAIWCAWKIGHVIVPDWVHSDALTIPEQEKKEKVKKPDIVRVPGERTSLRRAIRNQSVELPEETPSLIITLGTAYREKDRTSEKKPEPEFNLATEQIICEVSGEEDVKIIQPVNGNLTPPIAEEIMPAENPIVISTETQSPIISEPVDSPQISLEPADSSSAESQLNSNLAQAALASLGSQTADLNQNVFNTANMTPSGKKSRSKACEECRKSKRRCVHDELGRVDPAKAAEPSKPRGSSNTKRPARLSDELPQLKRSRIETGSDDTEPLNVHDTNIDALIDPALTYSDRFAGEGYEGDDVSASIEGVEDSFAMAIDAPQAPTSAPMKTEITQKLVLTDIKMDSEAQETMGANGEASNIAAGPDVSINKSITPAKSPEVTKSMITGEHPGQANGISPHSRHSARQTKQVTRYVPEDHRSPTKAPSKAPSGERRASSATSAQTMVTSTKSRRSSSNTSGTTHQIAASILKRPSSRDTSVKPGSRGSTAEESDADADERFARELQAAENGLRRRTSVRL